MKNKKDVYNLERFIKGKGGKRNQGCLCRIFPQYIGLGCGRQYDYFGITEFAEAVAFLAHPVLGPRLRNATAELLAGDAGDAGDAADGIKDVVKGMCDGDDEVCANVHSCMTLFDAVSPDDIFKKVLDKHFNGAKCDRTLMLIDADTRELTFELLLETNDPVMEVFPDYGNVVTSQMDYLDLKEQASSLKALVYKANTVNADLLAQVKKILDKNVARVDNAVLLSAVVQGETGCRCTMKNRTALNQILNSYNQNCHNKCFWYYTPLWTSSQKCNGGSGAGDGCGSSIGAGIGAGISGSSDNFGSSCSFGGAASRLNYSNGLTLVFVIAYLK